MNEFERTKALYHDLHRLDTKDGKVIASDFNLPNFVRKRAAHFINIEEISFIDLVNFILAYDEANIASQYSFIGEWLPTTKEFREWRDGLPSYGLEMLMAAYLTYGKQYVDKETTHDYTNQN